MRFGRLPLNQTQPGPTRVDAKHVFGHQNHVSAADRRSVSMCTIIQIFARTARQFDASSSFLNARRTADSNVHMCNVQIRFVVYGRCMPAQIALHKSRMSQSDLS